MKDVHWEALVVKNSGLGVLRGGLTEEGKLLVDNTSEAKLSVFMVALRPISEFLKNPDNLLFVTSPPALAGDWMCDGKANSLADAFTHPPFIFSRKQ